MPIIAKETGGQDFKIPDQGTYLAVCNMVVHMGVQPSKNPTYKPKDKIYIRWELPEERMEWEKDGVKHEGPMVIGSTYTLSLSPKAILRQDLEGWRGKAFTEEELHGFDVLKILGKPCLLTIVHNESGGKTYANVASVAALMKGQTAGESEMGLLKYSADEPQDKEKLPDWLQKKIDEQIVDNEFDQDVPKSVEEEFSDSIPF